MEWIPVCRSFASDLGAPERGSGGILVRSRYMTKRLTVAQAIIAFLNNQFVERDGRAVSLLRGLLRNLRTRQRRRDWAGSGTRSWACRYYLFRNEQAMVHAAAAFAKSSFRLRTMVCTTSIGPGATNMVTGRGPRHHQSPAGASAAGRYFCPAQRGAGSAATGIAFNARHFCERLLQAGLTLLGPDSTPRATTDFALPEAMRVLTSPAETGAVTLCLPQDVQAEAFDFPEEFLRQASVARSLATVATKTHCSVPRNGFVLRKAR